MRDQTTKSANDAYYGLRDASRNLLKSTKSDLDVIEPVLEKLQVIRKAHLSRMLNNKCYLDGRN